jgi:hypothetical protein
MKRKFPASSTYFTDGFQPRISWKQGGNFTAEDDLLHTKYFSYSYASQVLVTWRATIRITCCSTESLIRNFFILIANKALISPILRATVWCIMLHARCSTVSSASVSISKRTPPKFNSFFGLSVYSEDMVTGVWLTHTKDIILYSEILVASHCNLICENSGIIESEAP